MLVEFEVESEGLGKERFRQDFAALLLTKIGAKNSRVLSASQAIPLEARLVRDSQNTRNGLAIRKRKFPLQKKLCSRKASCFYSDESNDE
jgi:hypothetical protein